ncbi:MAG: RsmB/NOP family class I SAM-dependent RNA methyltransferase [Clostridia bacterium]|nr:RsmB/NOP family class I SAM-dependent RNA methyltransferase [Clostridia bacterium]
MHKLPDFLEKRFLDRFGAEKTESIISAFSVKRPVTARVNTIKATADEVKDDLTAHGLTVRTAPFWENALIVEGTDESGIAELEVYREGKIYLQSLSSMIPVLFLGAAAGENILDMAAAPGGKTTQIAAMTANGAFITACEKNKIRAERLKYNIERQGARRTTVMVTDSARLDPLFTFDRVLLDAPCSGSGTLELWRDKPPMIDEGLTRRSVRIQRTLLRGALAHMRRGSEMVYSTCSVLEEENEAQVCAALGMGAEIVPICEGDLPGVPLIEGSLQGTLTVCPNELYEGFFLAKLRKK